MKALSAARPVRSLALLLLFASPVLAGTPRPAEDIYRQGILPSGVPLVAERGGGVRLAGAAAACANCHRRSGLGMQEGRQSIPPIAGIYLFHPRAGATDNLDLPFVAGMRADRDSYSDMTLARAIRDGIGADGKPLSYLMPRYRLNDGEMSQLIDYLKQLSPGAVPGVTDSVLHFATIVTPDADPLRRKGVLEVITKFFEDKNHYVRAEAPRLQSSRRMMFKAFRHWELHVWELTGAPETWEAQLDAKLAAEPVFAVISGVGGATWAPVHRFCEEQALPCLFPNVDLPVVAEDDFDNLYLSKGVLLESELIARALMAPPGGPETHRVVQVYRESDVGGQAAAALAKALPAGNHALVNFRIPAGAGARKLAASVREARPGDILVLWLRPNDIAALGPVPAGVTRAFISGRMGGLEQSPVPADWRKIARMAYPVDLPERRVVRLDYPLGWFRIRQIELVAQEAQADTYLACGLVSDALNHMADTFVRDYLVERIEEMLEHRVITGYYPRLALAPGQRFASKGGYIVHFESPTGTRVIADGDWTVP